MDALKYFESEWHVISAAPFVVITLMLIAAVGGFVTARFWYERLASIARERRELSEEQTAGLRRQVEELKNRLPDADIAELRARIEKMPRIHVSDTPPEDSKAGDIWIQPS